LSKRKAVLIKWLDAKGVSSDWELLSTIEPQEPCIVHTIGFIQTINKRFITVFQSDAIDQISGRMTIPRVSIIKIKRLKDVKI